MGNDVQKWHCTRSETGDQARSPLVVATPYWQDARAFAAARFGEPELGDLIVVPCSEDHRADVELRFVGDDYLAGGTPGGRRREIRERVGDEWGPWKASP